ncbi:cation transporter, partial [Glycomyces tenuis]|uniref:cation transporter n=1 Tax=Glycomyces tenuis TaxID=58116 RepID=UPI001B809235
MTEAVRSTQYAGPSEAQRVVFAIEGMTCASCARRVEKTLAKQDGVTEAEVNFATATAYVDTRPGEADVDALQQAVDR